MLGATCDVESATTSPAVTRAATQKVPRRIAGHSPTVWRGLMTCAFPVRGHGASRGCFGLVVSLSWSAPEGRLFAAGVLGGRIDVGVPCPERGGRIDELLPGGWMLRLLKEGGLMNEACPDSARSAGFWPVRTVRVESIGVVPH